jgi:hypothetical protein
VSARCVIPDDSGFPARWLGGFAVVERPAGRGFLTPPALAGEPCAVLAADAAGLIADLPGTVARRLVRLAALDEVMPVHAPVTGAVAAAAREAALAAAGGG